MREILFFNSVRVGPESRNPNPNMCATNILLFRLFVDYTLRLGFWATNLLTFMVGVRIRV